ncbi:hypothetical protein LCGC14_1429110 [marine sediment metagenome]|uniref:Uncharacterized protein n=1 Tax=marine sediment metagenome TaxID=412755 RepID=A0A0F9M4J3_9ZZZZ
MSDSQKLKDAINEYRKENKDLDDKLNKAEQNNRQNRIEQKEQSNH